MTTRTPHVPPASGGNPLELGGCDLAPHRRRALKDDLLRRIDADLTPAAQVAAPARAPRLLRPALLLPACLLAATAVVATSVTGGHTGHRPASAAPGRADAAAVWLDHAATVSARTDEPGVRPDQYVYVRSAVRDNTGVFGGPVHLGPLHTREAWLTQAPGRVSHVGALRESGPGAVMPGERVPIEYSGGQAAGVRRPTYAWLAALPTDPGELLRVLRHEVPPVERESVDHAVFDTIGDLLAETIVPPRTAAAFYRLTARIPGVTVIPDAVDASGRHGIGITLEDGASATRNEWIFDRDTFAYLGDRGYFTGRNGHPDVLASTRAVLRRAAVDTLGGRTGARQDTPGRTAG